MTTFEAALAAWIAFHSELGVNIEATFMPPATEGELVAAERAIGFSLPDDLRSLYKVANGQYDTCLLYTSPSPRDRTRSRMPSSA